MRPGARRTRTRYGIPVTVELQSPPQLPLRSFARWVAESTPSGGSVVNVGGGCNASGRFPVIRSQADYLVAVDPSARVLGNSDADDRYQLTLEEFAVDHPQRFDVAFAVYVMEHVTDPVAFTEAAFRVLKPGGAFMAITPNKWHYFGFTTWATSRLGLNEWLLRRVLDPHRVDEYHFRTEYRINSIRSTSRHLEHAGFSGVEFRMWDLPRMYRPYLPRQIRGVAPAWSKFSYTLGRPNLMGHLTFKATLKAGSPSTSSRSVDVTVPL